MYAVGSEHPLRERARRFFVDLLARGEYGRAAQMFKDIGQKYPKSAYQDDLPYYEAWARYKIGTTDELRNAAKLLEPRASKLIGVVNTSNNSNMQFYGFGGRRRTSDGDVVGLGGTTLTAHLTPGHTKGCTTWTLETDEKGHRYYVVIVGSPNVNPGYKLVGNKQYPGIAADYEKTFRVLSALPCDIFLGAHGIYYNMDDKLKQLRTGGRNPFIDPEGYKAYVQERERAFRAELSAQQQSTR